MPEVFHEWQDPKERKADERPPHDTGIGKTSEIHNVQTNFLSESDGEQLSRAIQSMLIGTENQLGAERFSKAVKSVLRPAGEGQKAAEERQEAAEAHQEAAGERQEATEAHRETVEAQETAGEHGGATQRERTQWKLVEVQRERLERRISQVRQLASDFRQQLERADHAEMSGELRDEAALLEVTCDNWEFELSALVEERDPQAAFAMSLTLEARINALEDFIKRYPDLAAEDGQEPAPQKKASRRQRVREFLNLLVSIRHDLWALIAELLTPTEWTLKGNVQLPMLANAGIEIKFGSRQGETRGQPAPRRGR